jgi:hypothetical protein
MFFYVYQYLDEFGVPFYIGKGQNNRINAKHLYVDLPPMNQRQIIKSNLTQEEAFELENKLIRYYGRKIDGGILENKKLNQWACAVGWKHSEKTKSKISEKNTGKVRTDEHRKKYSIAKQSMTEETKQKIREANLGKIGYWANKTMPTKGKPWSQARRDSYLKSKGVIS